MLKKLGLTEKKYQFYDMKKVVKWKKHLIQH